MPTTATVLGYSCDLAGLVDASDAELDIVRAIETALEGDSDFGWYERVLGPLVLPHSPPGILEMAIEDEVGGRFLFRVHQHRVEMLSAKSPEVNARFSNLRRSEVLRRPAAKGDPFSSGPIKRRIDAVERAMKPYGQGLPPAEVSNKARIALDHPANADAELRKILFRAVTMRRHEEAFDRLIRGLREESDPVADVIASLIWRQGPLVDRIPDLLMSARDRGDDPRLVGRLERIVAEMKT